MLPLLVVSALSAAPLGSPSLALAAGGRLWTGDPDHAGPSETLRSMTAGLAPAAATGAASLAESLVKAGPVKLPFKAGGKPIVVRKGMAIDTDGQVTDPTQEARRRAMRDRHTQRSTSLRYGNGRYLDPMALPFIVVPRKYKRLLGHFAVVEYGGRRVAAVVGDVGPRFGEGSVALAEELGIDSHGVTGGVGSGVTYTIYPGSGLARWPDEASLLAGLWTFSQGVLP